MEAIGDAVGVVDLPCHLEGRLDPADGLLQLPALPEEDSRGGSGHHPGVGPESKSSGVMDLRVVELDRPVEVWEPDLEVSGEGGCCPVDVVTFDQHRVVAGLFTELEQLPAELGDRGEFGDTHVVGSQGTEHREPLRRGSYGLRGLHGLLVRGLGFWSVAADGHHRPGQTHPECQLLGGDLR